MSARRSAISDWTTVPPFSELPDATRPGEMRGFALSSVRNLYITRAWHCILSLAIFLFHAVPKYLHPHGTAIHDVQTARVDGARGRDPACCGKCKEGRPLYCFWTSLC